MSYLNLKFLSKLDKIPSLSDFDAERYLSYKTNFDYLLYPYRPITTTQWYIGPITTTQWYIGPITTTQWYIGPITTILGL